MYKVELIESLKEYEKISEPLTHSFQVIFPDVPKDFVPFIKQVKEGEIPIFIAKYHELIVGFAGICRVQDLLDNAFGQLAKEYYPPDTFALVSLGVVEEHRNNGIAKQLISKRLSWLKENDIYKIIFFARTGAISTHILTTYFNFELDKSNDNGMQFYKKRV